MFKYILLICLFLWPAVASCQTGTNYFDEHWTPTSKKHAEYVRNYSWENDLYKVEDRYASGELYCTSYRTEVESNRIRYREGEIVFYTRQGQKMREGKYLHGKRDGTWKFYNTKTGALKERITYYAEPSATDSEQVIDIDSLFNDDTLKPRPTLDYTRKGVQRNEESKNAPLVYVEQMPMAGFNIPHYLSKNLVYPSFARKAGIEGKVVIKFVVDEDGGITNVRVINGIGGGCDEEAARVIADMPNWTPGYQNEEPVRVYFTIPITFKLK
ncbi:MAG: TonB family protein [Taibaiella sp.]|nr:TonB family protein [Taibaiella sp.]